jgi:predicted esterase
MSFLSKGTCVAFLVCVAACDGNADGEGAGGQIADGGQTSDGGSGGVATGGASTGGAPSGGASPQTPAAEFVPSPASACPELVDGVVSFAPSGIAPRDVRIWISDAAETLDGPLVFYWHGTGSEPLEAQYGIGQEQLDAILDAGGIVAAPFHDPNAGQFPWYLTAGGNVEDDLLVADEVLACAIDRVGVDMRRIHSMGMSAGGLQTVQFGYRRSGYLASVAPYSGGLLGAPPMQDESNKFPAMILHGGMNDQVIVNFKQISEAYQADLEERGHFAFLCDHGGEHSIPTDARESVHRFLMDHPFGTRPSPYEGGLPEGFPSYCFVP